MQKGTIVSLGDRQSGFLRRVGIKEHLFFHADDLVKGLQFGELKVGDKMCFRVTESNKGPYATNVGRQTK